MMKRISPLREYIEDRVIWPYPGTVIIHIHRNQNRKSISVYLANSWMLFVVFGCQQDNGEWYLHLNEVNNLAIDAYNEWQKNRYKPEYEHKKSAPAATGTDSIKRCENNL